MASSQPDAGPAREKFMAGLRSLPKVELHADLGGSIRVSTVEELLVANGWSSVAAAKRAAEMVIPKDKDGIPIEPCPFEGFQIANQANINTPELCHRVVREYLEDCAADGVVYAELRTGGEDRDWMEQILKGFDEAKLAGVDCVARLILSIKRDKPAALAEKVVDNAIALKTRGVVAIDFCGVDTHSFPFSAEFATAVHRATAAGLSFVPHFAELSGEQDLLDLLAAKPCRLGHAVFMDENPEVGRQIREARIAVECCLVNNLNTMKRDGHLPEVLSAPPAKYHRMFSKWMAEGHPLALCCDNRTHTGGLSENYFCAASLLGETEDEMKAAAWDLAYNAVALILAEDDVKEELKCRLCEHPWCPAGSKKRKLMT
eukprot:TRINITY_DN90741_c0_g1_i1.p1 TRINITY_DN90741_c0_g1~~TRINITY_DN90741_c0_g1_i1.p1  ORF type:complete len:374 (+),score=66.83 TRINITY_DN90741_c0_g1_i1:68-1189(+)